MIRNIVAIILLIGISVRIGYSQPIDDYTLIQSKGKIPEDFLVKSSDTYRQSSQEIGSEQHEKKFDKKARNQFLLKSSFDIRELLYSGKIVFNDTLSTYISKVADKLLEKDPALRAKLRFYVVQSPVVNAFTTNSGQIFINMGLLAYLRNESQLAFILAHEIMHYKKQHVLKSYVETQKILYKRGEYRWNAREDDKLTRNRYSRELESEADLSGYDEILKNTDYTTKDLPYLFEVLKYADLPYKHEPIDPALLKIGKLPDSVRMNTDISIKERTDSDTTSTHPAPDRRSNALRKKYEILSLDGKQEYLVSKEMFEYCRNTARMHLPFMYLSRNNFEKTIYYAALIQQEYPDSKYLKDMIGRGLYGYAIFRSKKGYSSYDSYDGGIKRFSEWLNKLNDVELHLIVFNYFKELKEQYPSDPYYDTFVANTAKDMVKNESYTYAKIYKDYLAAQSLKPYERVPSETFSGSSAPLTYFFKLVDSMMLKGTMKTLLEDASATIDKEEKENKSKNRKDGKKKRMLNKYGACLGIDSIVVVNPDYEKIDQRKKKSQRYVASEAAQLDLNKKIEQNAGLNGIHLDVIDDHILTANDVGKYNDLAMLTNWFDEKIYQYANDLELGNLNPELVQQLKAKYGTKYFAWTGFHALREKKRNAAAILVFSAVYFPALPFAIYYLAKPMYNTYHYFVLFDIEKGQPVFIKSQYIKKRDRKDLLNSSLYDTFYQIKTKKK